MGSQVVVTTCDHFSIRGTCTSRYVNTSGGLALGERESERDGDPAIMGERGGGGGVGLLLVLVL